MLMMKELLSALEPRPYGADNDDELLDVAPAVSNAPCKMSGSGRTIRSAVTSISESKCPLPGSQNNDSRAKAEADHLDVYNWHFVSGMSLTLLVPQICFAFALCSSATPDPPRA